MVLKAKLVFKEYFLTSCTRYLLRIAGCFTLFIMELAITYLCCSCISGMNEIISFVIKILICTIVPNLITIILFYKTDDFKYLIELTKRMIKKKKG